jgi:phage-related tail fiber protein
MSNTFRIKRRASGSGDAPANLENAELAFNEVSDVLYYGKGTGGVGGSATTVEAIGGKGAFLSLSGAQSVAGIKTFTDSPVVPTVADSDSTQKAASTAFVKNQNYITASASITGNAATATALQTARNISLSGDATGSVSFNGTADVTIAAVLANSGVTAGTHTKVTVDAKGRVTVGAALAASDIPTLTANKISDFDTQVRTNRLDQMAAPTTSVSLNNQRITGLADPTSAQDAATKAYVDATVQGLDVKDSVRVATTGNITLSGIQTIDGITLVAGDRVLVKNQSTASQNGIYVVASGAWTRAGDFDTSQKVTPGAFAFVEEGTVNADSGWVLTTDGAVTLGTTALTFVQFSGAGQIDAGNGLVKSGNTLSVGAGTGIATTATTVDLTGQALALHNLSSNGLFVRTGAGTVAARAVAASGSGISVSNGNGVSGDPTLSLSAALSSVGGLTPQADRIAYYTGASTAALATLTTFGRSLIDDADAAAGRTTLGLGSMATQNANNVAITGGSITGITFDGGTF